MTGSFFNGSNKWTAFFVLNLVEFEWGILTENDEKNVSKGKYRLHCNQKWGLRGELFYLE